MSVWTVSDADVLSLQSFVHIQIGLIDTQGADGDIAVAAGVDIQGIVLTVFPDSQLIQIIVIRLYLLDGAEAIAVTNFGELDALGISGDVDVVKIVLGQQVMLPDECKDFIQMNAKTSSRCSVARG